MFRNHTVEIYLMFLDYLRCPEVPPTPNSWILKEYVYIHTCITSNNFFAQAFLTSVKQCECETKTANFELMNSFRKRSREDSRHIWLTIVLKTPIKWTMGGWYKLCLLDVTSFLHHHNIIGLLAEWYSSKSAEFMRNLFAIYVWILTSKDYEIKRLGSAGTTCAFQTKPSLVVPKPCVGKCWRRLWFRFDLS